MMKIAGESTFLGFFLIFNNYANDDHSKIVMFVTSFSTLHVKTHITESPSDVTLSILSQLHITSLAYNVNIWASRRVKLYATKVIRFKFYCIHIFFRIENLHCEVKLRIRQRGLRENLPWNGEKWSSKDRNAK